MRIVAGWIDMETGTRQEFLDAVSTMVEATRAESGCQAYVFSPDPTLENRIRLYELWEDQAALDAHLGSDHMAVWQQVRAGLPVIDSEILKYDISAVGPVRP